MRIDVLQIIGTALLIIVTAVLVASNIEHLVEENYRAIVTLTIMTIIGFWQLTDWMLSLRELALKWVDKNLSTPAK